MINNSALAATRGTINGIGQSLVALGRGAGPSIGALSFAWSERNGESEQKILQNAQSDQIRDQNFLALIERCLIITLNFNTVIFYRSWMAT